MTTGHEPDHFESTDWDRRPVRIALVAGTLFIAFALGASALTVKLVTRYRHQTDEPAVFAAKHVPPVPRLQVDEAADMQLYRRRQNELLSSYGWVNKPLGQVRIPIERAMEITAREAAGKDR